MDDDNRLLIRGSYRHVFKQKWLLYKIDEWRLPVPVPLPAIGWFAVALALAFVVSRLPLLGDLVGVFNPVWRYAIFPLAVAALMMQAAPDGRTARQFAVTLLGYYLRSRRKTAGRKVVSRMGTHGALPVRSDHHRPDLANARIHGPITVKFLQPMVISEIWGNRKRKRARPQRSGRMGDVTETVVLDQSESLDVSP